jgi:phosphoribosyl-dephospho-CoA transferase
MTGPLGLQDLAPHDLLRLGERAALRSARAIPEWVREALQEAPFVVVRRVLSGRGTIPVGVRGSTRNARFAASLGWEAIVARVTPEQLARQRAWRVGSREAPIASLTALERLADPLDRFGLAWGPTGSVGFELATGVAVAHSQSDLDLVVRAQTPLSRGLAKELERLVSAVPVRVDVQIETPQGAIALAEYTAGPSKLLLRTRRGPRLVTDAWASPAGVEGAGS